MRTALIETLTDRLWDAPDYATYLAVLRDQTLTQAELIALERSIALRRKQEEEA